MCTKLHQQELARGFTISDALEAPTDSIGTLPGACVQDVRASGTDPSLPGEERASSRRFKSETPHIVRKAGGRRGEQEDRASEGSTITSLNGCAVLS